MSVYALDQDHPQMHPNAWVAPSATVIGKVVLEADANVWYGVVVRGDTDTLTIGEGSNIQDGSVVHTDVGLPLVVGKHVTVGHQVILHGCQIGDETLIGMGAVILNGARIGKHCIVGAGSLVTEGKDFPDGSLIMGSPAKVVRQVRPEEIEKIRASAAHYVKNAQRHRQGLKPLVG